MLARRYWGSRRVGAVAGKAGKTELTTNTTESQYPVKVEVEGFLSKITRTVVIPAATVKLPVSKVQSAIAPNVVEDI